MTVGRIPNVEGGIQPTLLTTAGDIMYASSASNPDRLGIGTAGQILAVNSGATAPEWSTISAGGMTLLSTTTLSGTSTTISSINQTYNNLVILGQGVTWSTGNEVVFVNPNSVEISGSYSGVVNTTGTRLSRVQPNGNVSNASNANTNFVVTINNYTSAIHKPVSYYGQNPSATSGTANFAGSLQTTSAVTEIQITTVNGTATLSGTVLIYGVK
jgi:hypothetical protein